MTRSTASSPGSGGTRHASAIRAAVTSAGAPPAPGEAIARRPPLKPMSTTSMRRSSVSASAAAPRAIARRASSRGARTSSSSSRSADPGGSPAAADGASRTSPWRSPSVVSKRGSCSDIAPARRIVSSGRRIAAAATSAATSSIPRRSSGPGGSPAPTSTASTDGSRTAAVIASGSITSGLTGLTRQPVRRAASASGVTARSEAATATSRCGRHAPGDQAGQRGGGPAAVVAERPGQLRVGRLGPLQQQADDRVGVDRRGHRQEPIRRQRWRTRAISAAEVVAVPRSRARKALGSVTPSSYRRGRHIDGRWPRWRLRSSLTGP